VVLKKMFERLSKPTRVLDQEKLRLFCASHPEATPIVEVRPRASAIIVGEIASLRIVPRANGSQWLEATVSDGTGTVVAMWTGRRRIAGVHPGQKISIHGRGAPLGPGHRLQILNPEYELL
jgi:hypothetical protein